MRKTTNWSGGSATPNDTSPTAGGSTGGVRWGSASGKASGYELKAVNLRSKCGGHRRVFSNPISMRAALAHLFSSGQLSTGFETCLRCRVVMASSEFSLLGTSHQRTMLIHGARYRVLASSFRISGLIPAPRRQQHRACASFQPPLQGNILGWLRVRGN